MLKNDLKFFQLLLYQQDEVLKEIIREIKYNYIIPVSSGDNFRLIKFSIVNLSPLSKFDR
jgi:hypothetical protein